MTKIPEPRDPTLEAVDDAIAKNNQQEPRNYLGASGLGHACSRRLWMSWRWVLPEIIDATGWRNILDGFASEPIQAERLKAVPGVRLETHGPDDKQFGVSALGGHLKGHLDGVIKGLIQAPSTWHIWEHKCVGEKNYRKVSKMKSEMPEKEVLEGWNPTYFTQAQLYMGLAKKGPIKRHYMTINSAGNRMMNSLRTAFQKDKFDQFIQKAKDIIEASAPPPKISNDPNYFVCRWCHLNKICHDNTTAQVNCRTCAFATPSMDGNAKWACDFHERTISTKEQRKGCPKHLYIPELIPWAHVHQMDKINHTITYRTDKGTEFVNAEHNSWEKRPRHFKSKELQYINEGWIDNEDSLFEKLAAFKPTITGVKKKEIF